MITFVLGYQRWSNSLWKAWTCDRTLQKIPVVFFFFWLKIDRFIWLVILDVAPIYDLYAVSNHSGTPSFGHYTAYCKHVTSGQWFYYDDRNVRPVSANAVVSELAYVLFYELSPSSLAAAKL